MLKVGILDSGIGGLPFLSICRRIDEKCEYLYVADQKHFPYGKKSEDYIIERMKAIFQFFTKEQVNLVLVACNTASLEVPKIKDQFPFKVYSVIDLVVKNFENANFKHGVCIATDLTIASDIYKKRLANCNFELVEKKASTLVEMIQNHYSKQALMNEITNLDLSDADFVILGCTHFAWIKNLLNEMYPSTYLFDGTEKVKDIIGKELANDDSHQKGKLLIYTTKIDEDIVESLNELKIEYDALKLLSV